MNLNHLYPIFKRDMVAIVLRETPLCHVMATPRIEARYRTWVALRRDCDQQIAMGGMLLRITDVELQQFSPLVLVLIAPDRRSFELPSQVLQLIPGQGVALQFAPEAQQAIDQLKEACESSPPDSSAPETDDPEVSEVKKRRGGGRLQLATDPQELRRQLEGMTVNQKRQAALAGGRGVRILLMRDINKAVHPFVVKNPRVTVEEVEAFSKMPSVNPDALRQMAQNRDWTRSISVCRNLVRNPKTPLREALMLLEKLPLSDIRMLAKGGAVRAPIQQAARKKINQ